MKMEAENIKTRVFLKPLKPCIDGHGRLKLYGNQKFHAIAQENGQKNMKRVSFVDTCLTMYRWSPSLQIIPGT
jgi:hypothetical protein